MYKVIKSNCVKLSQPKRIKINEEAKELLVKNSDISQKNLMDNNKTGMEEDVSAKFYELLCEKEKFSQIIQREKKIIQFEKKKLEKEKSEIELKKEEAHKIYESEKKKGYEEGFQSGYDEGKREYEKLIGEALEIKKSVESQKKREIDSLEKELIEVVVESIEKIIGIKIDEDDEIIFNILKKGLDRLSYAESIVVRASDDYVDLFEKNKNKILLCSSGIKDIQVRRDDSMGKGEMLVETSSGTVDPSISTQVEIIKNKFRELLKGGE